MILNVLARPVLSILRRLLQPLALNTRLKVLELARLVASQNLFVKVAGKFTFNSIGPRTGNRIKDIHHGHGSLLGELGINQALINLVPVRRLDRCLVHDAALLGFGRQRIEPVEKGLLFSVQSLALGRPGQDVGYHVDLVVIDLGLLYRGQCRMHPAAHGMNQAAADAAHGPGVQGIFQNTAGRELVKHLARRNVGIERPGHRRRIRVLLRELGHTLGAHRDGQATDKFPPARGPHDALDHEHITGELQRGLSRGVPHGRLGRPFFRYARFRHGLKRGALNLCEHDRQTKHGRDGSGQHVRKNAVSQAKQDGLNKVARLVISR